MDWSAPGGGHRAGGLPPLRYAPRLAALIAAIGMSILLQNLAQFIFGSNQLSFPAIPVFSTEDGLAKGFSVGGAQVTYLQLFIIAVTVVAMVCLNFFVQRTGWAGHARLRPGQEYVGAHGGERQPRDRAHLPHRLAMGALGGGLYGAVYHFARPDMGFIPGLKAFIAAVLGGIGSIPGPSWEDPAWTDRVLGLRLPAHGLPVP